MRFLDTGLQGVLIIEPNDVGEALWARAFRERGLESPMVRTEVSQALPRHTLRGLHWQVGRSAGARVVQCLQGRMLEVVVDLRPGSPTFGQHEKVALDDDSGRMLYVPRGFACGFLTLDDDTKARSQVSNHQVPGARRGLRWNDPRLSIAWPTRSPILDDRDRTWPDLDSALVVTEA